MKLLLILQVIPGESQWLEKGVLGMVIVALIYVVAQLWNNQKKTEERNRLKFDEQEKRFQQYLDNDREEMIEALNKCTEALNQTAQMIKDFTSMIKSKNL